MPADADAGRGDSAGAQRTPVIYIPPQTSPGLGPATRQERSVDTAISHTMPNDE
jgi:hypothetical protein